jgi:glycosyltransferase involved in cell wall biosynthesis
VTLDLVIPAHNEERRIARTLRAYTDAFPHDDVRFKIALDGCVDDTAEVVLDLGGDDPRIELLDFPKLGKGGVLMEAFRRCDADWIAFVDADCATPPNELALLTEQAGRADGAIASRRHPTAVTPGHRPLARRVTSAGFATCIRTLFRLPYSDTQCGAKVVRREVLERALPLMSSRDFLFDVDLLVVARQLGFDIVEVPTVWVDQAESKLNAAADARRMLASAVRLWVHHQVLPIEADPPVRHDVDRRHDSTTGGRRVAA